MRSCNRDGRDTWTRDLKWPCKVPLIPLVVVALAMWFLVGCSSLYPEDVDPVTGLTPRPSLHNFLRNAGQATWQPSYAGRDWRMQQEPAKPRVDCGPAIPGQPVQCDVR
jgi:hypothetical protein